jgi:hypothetical protein
VANFGHLADISSTKHCLLAYPQLPSTERLWPSTNAGVANRGFTDLNA